MAEKPTTKDVLKYMIYIGDCWSITRDDFNHKPIDEFNKFVFDRHIEGRNIIPFGQFRFVNGMPVWLFDPSPIRDEDLEQLQKLSFTETDETFVCIDGTDIDNKKKIAEFTGTFIDAFKWINEHKHLMGY